MTESDPLDQTVYEFIFGPCSHTLLAELASENSYWEGVDAFIEDKKDFTMRSLSPRQIDWVFKIKNDLLDKLL